MPPILLELSVDSAIAAAALSLVVPPRRYALSVALFGIWDGGCSYIGAPLNLQVPAVGISAAVFLFLWGGLLLLNLRTINRILHSGLFPYLLPPVMAIDNLVGGDSHWVSDGLASSAMAALGFLIGFYLVRPLTVARPRPRVVALPILIAAFSLAT